MDIQELFVGVVIVLVGLIGITSFLSIFNTTYAIDLTQNSTDVLESNLQTNSVLSDFYNISISIANTTQLAEGGSQATQDDSLIAQSRSAFSQTTKLMGLIPKFIEAAAISVGVPPTYVALARNLFLTLFGLAIAYILLLGVKRLL